MKYVLKIILVALIIFNIIIASFLILDIQAFEPPKTAVQINIIDVNSEELILETIVNIQNKNNFDLSIQNFEVISTTEDGEEIGRIIIEGGNVKAGKSKIFSSLDNFILKNENITILKNKVSGKVSLKFFGFIEKSIPLEIDVITSISNVLNQIQQPDINIHTELTGIYEKGLNFTTQIQVYNPTNFYYSLEEIVLDIEKEDGTNVGQITLFGDTIEPQKTITLISDGSIFFDALDAEVLWLKLTGVAGMKIAGLYKNVKISAETSLIIPDIKEFIFGNKPIDFKIPVQFKFTLRGITSNIGFKMYNPSNFTLIGDELFCSILRKDAETYSILGEKIMDQCTILPQDEICVRTNITIPYLEYLRAGKGKFRPDWIVLRIEGDFHIAGTRQAVPISLNAYIDPHIFVNRNFDNIL